MRELRELAVSRVDVGVIGDKASATHQGTTEEPATVVDVATWNEYGLGVPERSFIRQTADLKAAEITRFAAKQYGDVVGGTSTAKSAMERVGMFTQGLIQQRIADGIPPENSPATIDRKGSDKPLIDTGQLRSSITYEVRR